MGSSPFVPSGNEVSIVNSTAIPLGIGSIFVGTYESTHSANTITISITSDQFGTSTALEIQWSSDGVSLFSNQTIGFDVIKTRTVVLTMQAAFVRVMYTNAAIAQTSFKLQTIFNSTSSGLNTASLAIDSSDDLFLPYVRSFGAVKIDGTENFKNITGAISGTKFAQHEDIIDRAGRLLGEVSVSSSILPSGASTAALQTQPGVDIGDVTINNGAGLASVNIQDGGNSITVDGTFFQPTQPISAVALPLPSGAATEATLSSAVTSLSNIDTKAIMLIISATVGANTALTATLPAVSGKFHYIYRIEIKQLATSNLIGGAILSISTTNLPDTLTWETTDTMTKGIEKIVVDEKFNPPLRSSVINTPSTVICPIPGNNVRWHINIFYNTGI